MPSVKKEKFFALRKGRGKQVHIFQVYATEKETHCIVAIVTPRAVPYVLASNVGVKGTWVLILIGKSKSEVRKKAEMAKNLRPGQPRVECKLYKSRVTASRRVCWSLNDLLKRRRS